jgi:hypothetical protein
MSRDIARNFIYVLIAMMLFSLLFGCRDGVEFFKGGFLDIREHLNEPVHMLSFMTTDVGTKRVYIGAGPKNARRYETYHLTYHDCSFNIDKKLLEDEFKHYALVVKEIDKRKPELGYTMFVRANAKHEQVFVDSKGLLYLEKKGRVNPEDGKPVAFEVYDDEIIGKGGFVLKLMDSDAFFVMNDDDGTGHGLIGFYGTSDDAMIVYFTDLIKEMISETRFCK